jgi:hypothetical protein
MLAEEEAASEDDHQEDRTTQEEHLEHLEHLATEEQLAEGEDAQENHAPEYEQLAMRIHDVPGGCWLMQKSQSSGVISIAAYLATLRLPESNPWFADDQRANAPVRIRGRPGIITHHI